jgi:EmrB/QacA subfamily drug resistance transporter
MDRALWLVSSVVILGAIMSILDTTIVNVAIDRLSQDFQVSLSTIQWVSTGYLLALSTVIPVSGWAADRFGTKRLYLLSIGLFLIGSALSGAAWSAGSLIVFRIVQGLGGGMIMPTGMTILARAAGPQRMGRTMSIVGIPMLIGPAAGPIIGGWFVDDFSWRWIFYINIPIGLAALLLTVRLLPRDEPQPTDRLDGFGLVLLSLGLASFVYGLAEMSSTGGATSTNAIVPLLAGLALIAYFVRHALRHRNPLLDLRLFQRRSVAASGATTFLFAMGMFGVMLLLPLYHQTVRGQSALMTGVYLLPQGLGAALTMPFAGKLTDQIGPGRVVLVGLTLDVAGMVGYTQVSATTSYWYLEIALLLMGLGMGCTMMPAMSAAYQTISHAAAARATTALNIVQRVGASIGVAVLSVLLQHEITSRIPGSGGLGAAQNVPPEVRASVAPKIADAFGVTFWVAAAMVAVGFIPALLLPRHRPDPADGEAAQARPHAEPVSVDG